MNDLDDIGEGMTNRQLKHLMETYRTAQNFTLGHVYRDIMKCIQEIYRLRAELKLLRQDMKNWQEALGSLTEKIEEEPEVKA